MGTREDSINGEDLNTTADESENLMRFESDRLETFQRWPPNAQVGAGKIARAGFYYTGSYLEVMFLQQSLKTVQRTSQGRCQEFRLGWGLFKWSGDYLKCSFICRGKGSIELSVEDLVLSH